VKIAFFSAKPFEKKTLQALPAARQHEWAFHEDRLSRQTVAQLSANTMAVCCFVTDQLCEEVLAELAARGVQLLLLRSAGFDHVDLSAARRLGLAVYRVPRYSPEAVAEFALGLLLSLYRKIPQAVCRTQANNFLLDGLLGENLSTKTVAVIGTGHIGLRFLRLLQGFDCRLLAFDPSPNPAAIELGVEYLPMPELLAQSDVLSLHCPLNEQTKHMVNAESLAMLKAGAVLINTARGAVVDTSALLDALRSGHLAGAALDVYEHEHAVFFKDCSERGVNDALLTALQAMPNVILTGHQAYLSRQALNNILTMTLDNVANFEAGVQDNAL
jgi:D-lactate dehydrogenase